MSVACQVTFQSTAREPRILKTKWRRLMRRVIESWHSPSLNREMQIVTYGHFGFPLLMFPTAAADFLEYERFYVIETIQEFIESGKVKVFSINSINREGWLNKHLPAQY